MKKESEWEVELHEEFDAWLLQQEEGIRREIFASAGLLRRLGPQLGRPKVDTLKGSEIPNLKELRVQYAGKPWRILFAFDPIRHAILLVGGMKAGKRDWYKVHIPIAERRFRDHLRKLKDNKKD